MEKEINHCPKDEAEEIKRAVELIQQTLEINDLELDVGITAMISLTSQALARMVSFNHYCDILDNAKIGFKDLWDKEKKYI